MQVHHHRIITYTAAGALSGAAATGLGALALHPADPDHFQRAGATVAGFVGGAVSHAALGTLAAFSPDKGMRHELIHLGGSGAISCLTSGVLGGAILGATGHHDSPTTWHMLLAGGVGGALLSVVAASAATALCCCNIGLWVGRKGHDVAEALIEANERVEHAAEDV